MSDKTAAKMKRTLLGIEIPRDELACRIAEQCLGLRRPPGASGTEALAQLEMEHADTVAAWRASADAAVLYFHECINAARRPS